MKKTFISLLALVVLNKTQAQFEKGRWILGGEVGYESADIRSSTGIASPSTRDEIYVNRFEFNLSTSYAVKKNILLTLGFITGGSTSRDNSLKNYYSSNLSGAFLGVRKISNIIPNLFLSQSLIASYRRDKTINITNIGLPSESKINNSLYYIGGRLCPFDISYCLKKRYLFTISLLAIDYRYDKANSNNGFGQYLNIQSNPFTNGFTFSYLFKYKKY